MIALGQAPAEHREEPEEACVSRSLSRVCGGAHSTLPRPFSAHSACVSVHSSWPRSRHPCRLSSSARRDHTRLPPCSRATFCRAARRGCSRSTGQETWPRTRSHTLASCACTSLSWAPLKACACRSRGRRRSTSTRCYRSSARRRASKAGSRTARRDGDGSALNGDSVSVPRCARPFL